VMDIVVHVDAPYWQAKLTTAVIRWRICAAMISCSVVAKRSKASK